MHYKAFAKNEVSVSNLRLTSLTGAPATRFISYHVQMFLDEVQHFRKNECHRKKENNTRHNHIWILLIIQSPVPEVDK